MEILNMEFITNLFSNDKVLSGLFANLDLIKLSYTFGGLLFIFSAAKVFYINFGLLEDDKPTWKVFLFNTYLFAMGFCYSEAAKLLPEKSQPNDPEKLFALAVLGIIVGIKAYRKIYGLNGYRQSFYANIWAPIKLTVLFIISVFTFGLFSFIMFEYKNTINGVKKANYFYRFNPVLIFYFNMLSSAMVIIYTPLLEQTEEKGKLLVRQRLSELSINKEDSLGRPNSLDEISKAMDERFVQLKKIGKEMDKKLNELLTTATKKEDSEQ